MSNLIHVNTPLVTDAQGHINTAYTATDQNHHQSLQIVANNAENYGGRGSEAFQQAIATVNYHYGQHKETIQRAAQVLGMANDGFTCTDGQCAAQY